MRVRTPLGLALAAILLATSAAPAGPADRPAVLLRLAALEELIGDLRFLVKEVGREEQVRQFEALLKARTGPKGLEGVDVKKPIGLYALVKPSLSESEVVLLLPIADEKAFLDFLDGLNFKPEKDKDGLYTLQVENVPVPLLFRFANGYLYGTAKLSEKTTLPGKDQLPAPAKVLAGGAGLLSLTGNIDQVPAQVRKLGVSASALVLGELKENPPGPPGEREKIKPGWEATLDALSRLVKAVLEDGTATQLKIDLDRKAKALSVSFTLEGKPGSTLPKYLASLRPEKSVAAGFLGKETVMGGQLYLAMPEEVRKASAPAIEAALGKALEQADANARALLAPLVDALKPTATSGRLDVGLDMRGPGKKGKYTAVVGMQVEKGATVEKALKELLDKLPPDAKEPIQVDAAKEGSVNIHRVTQKNVEPRAKELFGDGPLYFALRDDAVFLSMGEDALGAIQEAVRSKPAAGQPLRLTISAARLAPLMAQEQKAAPEAAKKAFTEPGSDQVQLTVTAGERFEVRLSIKTAVLAFASLLERAKE